MVTDVSTILSTQEAEHSPEAIAAVTLIMRPLYKSLHDLLFWEPGVKTPTPEARRAHALVRRALRNGSLIRPEACEACDHRGFIEAAHQDYAQPMLIHWLCRSCHRSWDYWFPKNGTAVHH